MLKQIVACLMIAALVSVACYFLPFISRLFGDYVFGFFIAALILPIGLKWYETHMVKVRALSKNGKVNCSQSYGEDNEVTTCLSNCHDLRNIDQQHHVLNGFKD
ncbi:hypothetical protein SAMN05421686_1165 [Thalassolituus maritimus]|uniref:Lipoprotein n=1 Tax=Thalassolituus maritimus TaxID=484498 RepID=A0A1N7Q916_9GAMM|nr:hypothetical protein [Thalassolituus maritimus]SIT19306.1 hypothetical protein SAMN05421686_1165 [Thalassolituus maritimus]